MIKDIVFERQEDGGYAASFVSTGPATLQARRTTNGTVSVSANIPGMEPVVVGVYQNPYNFGILIGIDLPVGMEVRVESHDPIAEAKLMGDD